MMKQVITINQVKQETIKNIYYNMYSINDKIKHEDTKVSKTKDEIQMINKHKIKKALVAPTNEKHKKPRKFSVTYMTKT